MASPKNPGQLLTLPKLTDPNNIQEVFANHTVGISLREGMVHITLSVIRPKHSLQGHGNEDENVVVTRITLPTSAMDNLVGGYGQLQKAVQLQTAQTDEQSKLN